MPLASSRILGHDEKRELGMGTSPTPAWALQDENGDTIAYVRKGDGTGRPGYGWLWKASYPGEQARDNFGRDLPYRNFPEGRSIHLDTLPILGLTDSSD